MKNCWPAPTADRAAPQGRRHDCGRRRGRPTPARRKVEVQQTRHAFLFGCNIFSWGRLPDEKTERAYRQRFAELLNYATLPFYWWSYERRQGEPNHLHAEEVALWCQQQGILTKGHPLAWNHNDARWYPDDPRELFRLQLARIDDCVKRFAGLIDRWDVVNEAIALRPARGPEASRRSTRRCGRSWASWN